MNGSTVELRYKKNNENHLQIMTELFPVHQLNDWFFFIMAFHSNKITC